MPNPSISFQAPPISGVHTIQNRCYNPDFIHGFRREQERLGYKPAAISIKEKKMNSHLNRLRTVVLPLILGMFLSGCATNPQPQNTNTRAQSNQNAGAATAPRGSAPEGWV